MDETGASVFVRPLDAADKPAWLPLWRGYLAFYRAEIAEEISELTFRRLTDPAEPMQGALGWVRGEAVGLTHLVRHRSTWTRGD